MMAAQRKLHSSSGSAAQSNTELRDCIGSYLSEPVIVKAAIEAAGGYLKYWQLVEAPKRPKLAGFAMDILSAPGQFNPSLLFVVILINLHFSLVRECGKGF